MKEKQKAANAAVGVIIGRFQVHELHEAHKDLIQTVTNNHDKVIIFLGLSPVRGTLNNPLDFESRKQMILETFPDVNVLYIEDVVCDEVWSKRLDTQIGHLIGPNQSVALYGGRDSFIKHYKGKFTTIELESDVIVSATEIRKKIRNKVKPSADFRAGAIWSTGHRYPTVFTTVDVAIFDDENRLLLARKPNETLYRFVGGFSDVGSVSFEQDAKREVMEETGLEVSEPEYIGSRSIADWRYASEQDKIRTLFFKVKRIFGSANAQDDIESLKWFNINDLKREDLVVEHRELFDMLIKNINK